MHAQTVFQAVCLLALSGVIQAQTLAINNVGIIDMNTGEVQKSQNILIEDNMIVDIQNAETNLRAADSFDASGLVIMPGLVDMHVHLFFTNDASQFATTDISVLPPLLANGITTVQDLVQNMDYLQRPRLFQSARLIYSEPLTRATRGRQRCGEWRSYHAHQIASPHDPRPCHHGLLAGDLTCPIRSQYWPLAE